MKSMIELLRARRSIRKYEPRAIEPETVELLKEALLRSPTSRNFRPWEFYFVTDASKLRALSECKPHGAAFLSGAPLGVVICADPDTSDVWIEDASIAAILLQLTAQDLGLGSCWLQVRNRQHADGTDSEQYVRNLLNLPEKLRVLAVIGLGYPAETREPLTADALLSEKIHLMD